ncbi:hypothetical protein Godav_018792 [Gossypium davidsonii]|uniref:Uncharacterized protein n=2 Tax=Gossypium TaxID=3633 RepID=A0A7J8QXL0_GOSDV|nr:hypothetical protein [Gossypium davidsonii]MBA0641266.1 hypothetical protein [Gossypium klotzschianum]
MIRGRIQSIEMRCSACRRELEGPAISTHLLCKDDESKIHGNDTVCLVCDQVLSKR